MPRYDQWRRLKGDTADHPALLDLGKKLLGYLAEQRSLSGVKTMSIERSLPDGSVVRARFDGDLPCIEVRASRPAPNAQQVLIDGFVTLPHTDSLPDGSADVLLPRAGKPPFYFDDSFVPEGLESWVPYGTNGIGEPEFSDGLQKAGNVDWRNKDESLIVSWWGPNSRYFSDNGDVSQTVYKNGRQLFSLSDIDTNDTPEFLGYPGRWVHGAALRRFDGALWLLVAGLASKSAAAFDFLLRVPVVVDPASPARQKTLKPEIAPRVVVDMDRLEVVFTAALSAHRRNNDKAYLHPWFFNQSATEAKRVYQSFASDGSSDDCAVEATMTCERMDAVSVDSIEHVYHRTLRTERQPCSFVWSHPTGAYQVAGDATWLSLPSTIDGPVFDDFFNNVTSLVLLDGRATSSMEADPIMFAVDYRDDEAVYGYLQSGEFTATTTGSMPDWSMSPMDTQHSSFTDASNYSWHDNLAYSGTYTFTNTSREYARLILPDETIECVSTQTMRLDNAFSRTFNRSIVAASGFPLSDTWLNVENRTLDIDDLYEKRILIPYFVDMRCGLAVTGIATSSRSGAESRVSIDAVNQDGVVDIPVPPSPGASQTFTTSIDTRVSLRGEELHATSAEHVGPDEFVYIPPLLGTPNFLHGPYNPFSIAHEPYMGGVQGTATTTLDQSSTPATNLQITDSTSLGAEYVTATATTATTDDYTTAVATADSLIGVVDDSGADPSWMFDAPWRHNASLRCWGGWACFKGTTAVAMPWPSGDIGTPNFLNRVADGDMAVLTGQPLQARFTPLWVLPPTEYLRVLT